MTRLPEHLGLVVPRLEVGMDELAVLGHTWSPVSTPTARLRRSGLMLEETTVRYVVSSGGLPRVKLIEEVPGTYWQRSGRSTLHHLTYWVEDVEEETGRLVLAGAEIEADGLEEDGELRYRYLVLASGTRVELGRLELRAEFESWARS